jgi:hypothetical protein
MENYGAVETFPKTMEEAKAKYDEKFLTKMEFVAYSRFDGEINQSFKDKRKTKYYLLR